MARILEIVVYILFAMLSFYKFFNDYIEINKEYGYKIAIYIAIFFYLIFEKYGQYYICCNYWHIYIHSING